MTLLSDQEIFNMHQEGSGLVDPFTSMKVGNPSYGLSSYGYDITLGNEFVYWKEHKGFTFAERTIIPGKLNQLEEDIDYGTVRCDERFIIDPGKFVLAHSVETFHMPNDVIGLVKDKSTYARLGVAVQNTVLEPGWSGQLTLEITNHNNRPVALMVGMGIAQVMFWRGEPCRTPYKADGKYQNQKGVVIPR